MYRVTSGRAWSQPAVSNLEPPSALQTARSQEGQATTDSTLHLASSSGALLSRYQEATLTADAIENDGPLALKEHWASVSEPENLKKRLDDGVTND